MTELILVRHGETPHTRLKIFSGMNDMALTGAGRARVESVAPAIRARGPAAVYSSDIARCRETAEILDLECETRFDPRLREMDFGYWEGLTWEQVRSEWPRESAAWERDWIATPVTGGESMELMARRVLEFCGELSGAGPVAVVTHAGCIMAILGHYIAGGLERSGQFAVEPGLFSRILITGGGARLLSLNEGLKWN